MKNYLPIGTVVRLKNGVKKLMIFGRVQKAKASGKIYDYAACLYPEGNLDSKHTFLFNETDIEEIVFMGYSDELDKELQRKLNEILY